MKSEVIYILGSYPSDDRLKDGAMQRIKSVHDLLNNYKRIYINISLKNPFFKCATYADGTIEMYFNPFSPYAIISKFLRKAKIIYAHSIHPFQFIFYAFLFLNKHTRIILDAHGVVPEELRLNKKLLRSLYAKWIEQLVFRNIQDCICVSNAMVLHYKKLYKHSAVRYYILFTSDLLAPPLQSEITQLAKELNLDTSKSIIIYSGNTQLWQNIEKMLIRIRQLLSDNIQIIILTGELQKFRQLLKENNINENSLILKSVHTSELAKFYSLAHYGFILRDDLVVNNVANPTKMLEYLQFGIIPIVITPNIGDYNELGYDYVRLENLTSNSITAHKSDKNIKLAADIIEQKKNFKMEELLASK